MLKRDMSLIREILILLESDSLPSLSEPIGEWDVESVEYHKYLVLDSELAEGMETKMRGGNEVRLFRLNSKGHDFLDSAQSPAIWGMALEKVKKIGGRVTIGTMQNLLTSLVNEQLGLHQ